MLCAELSRYLVHETEVTPDPQLEMAVPTALALWVLLWTLHPLV